MLDAALDTAEAFNGFTTSQGDLDSGENLKRLTEIAVELRATSRNDDALGAARLIAEAGRLIGLEILTRASEAGENAASAVGTIASVPLNLWPAAKHIVRLQSAQPMMLDC